LLFALFFSYFLEVFLLTVEHHLRTVRLIDRILTSAKK